MDSTSFGWSANHRRKALGNMHNEITDAGLRLLGHAGLDNWSIAGVANEAGCAKGLVHYYFKSKVDLLVEMATRLHMARGSRRAGALEAGGTEAIDRLWEAIESEVRDGSFASWLALSTVREPKVRAVLKEDEASLRKLGGAAAQAFGLDEPELDLGRMIESGLTGIQVGMLRGTDPLQAREVHHRFWLALLR